MVVPSPNNEAARVAVLHGYDILDTLPEPSYDDIVLLASQICRAPIAAVSFIDSERQWFKAQTGITLASSPRELSFCAHTIMDSDLLVIPNALEDVRFANNPLVKQSPHIRFYAGAPLTTERGEALGTLCVIDCVERTLSEAQANALRSLSRQVMAQLELRQLLEKQIRTQRRLEISQSQLKEVNVQLHKLSMTDDVTGFHNTRFLHHWLDDKLKVAEQEGEEIALIFFDMDRFKQVVDTHGHQLGSKILKEVAQVVKEQLAEGDRIVRYGGDEFVILLPAQNRRQALQTAERMRRAINQRNFLSEENLQVRVTASFGLAVYPEDAKSKKQLLLAADQSLFQSKDAGRNRISTPVLLPEPCMG